MGLVCSISTVLQDDNSCVAINVSFCSCTDRPGYKLSHWIEVEDKMLQTWWKVHLESLECI